MNRAASRVAAVIVGSVLLTASAAVAQPSGCPGQSKDEEKCKSAIAKSLGKFVATVIKCHIKQADAALKGTPVDD